jgi:hypothetical protein
MAFVAATEALVQVDKEKRISEALVVVNQRAHNVIGYRQAEQVTDTSQTYLQFLMLHACLHTIFFVFCYTLWHFYAFSGTNLLTRCHSASSLYFRKAT